MGFIARMKRGGVFAGVILIAASVFGPLLADLVLSGVHYGIGGIFQMLGYILRGSLNILPGLMLLAYFVFSFGAGRCRVLLPIACILRCVILIMNNGYAFADWNFISAVSNIAVLMELAFFIVMTIAGFRGMGRKPVTVLAAVLLAMAVLSDIVWHVNLGTYVFGWHAYYPIADYLESVMRTILVQFFYLGLLLAAPKAAADGIKRPATPAAASAAPIEDVRAALTELARRYDCGEISYEEYSARREEILARF